MKDVNCLRYNSFAINVKRANEEKKGSRKPLKSLHSLRTKVFKTDFVSRAGCLADIRNPFGLHPRQQSRVRERDLEFHPMHQTTDRERPSPKWAWVECRGSNVEGLWGEGSSFRAEMGKSYHSTLHTRHSPSALPEWLLKFHPGQTYL